VSLGLYLVRIGQFWALNLCTFFGFVVGWLLLTRLLRFSRRELFYLAGGWGLFAEKILFELPGEKLYFLLNAPPMILTYGLIITPALLSQPPTGRWRLHPMLSYPLAYMVLYAVSVPGIVVLMLLRGRYPGLFPPTSMVGS